MWLTVLPSSAASVVTACVVASASSYAAIASREATSARAATSSFIPEDKLSRRAFALAVMADVVPGRRTMHSGVEVSWALPL